MEISVTGGGNIGLVTTAWLAEFGSTVCIIDGDSGKAASVNASPPPGFRATRFAGVANPLLHWWVLYLLVKQGLIAAAGQVPGPGPCTSEIPKELLPADNKAVGGQVIEAMSENLDAVRIDAADAAPPVRRM